MEAVEAPTEAWKPPSTSPEVFMEASTASTEVPPASMEVAEASVEVVDASVQAVDASRKACTSFTIMKTNIVEERVSCRPPPVTLFASSPTAAAFSKNVYPCMRPCTLLRVSRYAT